MSRLSTRSTLLWAATLASVACTDVPVSDGPLAADPTEANAPQSADELPAPTEEMSLPQGPPRLAPDAGMLQAARRADAVVYAQVTDITYGLAELQGNAEGAVPLTWVTVTVLEGLRGGVPGEALTLMFAGGPLPDGSITMPADQPLFDVGDTDVLMVADNGVNGCPLVDCADGRVRVLDGGLYTDSGRALQVDERGQVRRGPRLEHEAVRFNKIGDQVLERTPSGTALAFVPDTLGVWDLAAALPVERFAVASLSVDPATPPVIRY